MSNSPNLVNDLTETYVAQQLDRNEGKQSLYVIRRNNSFVAEDNLNHVH